MGQDNDRDKFPKPKGQQVARTNAKLECALQESIGTDEKEVYILAVASPPGLPQTYTGTMDATPDVLDYEGDAGRIGTHLKIYDDGVGDISIAIDCGDGSGYGDEFVFADGDVQPFVLDGLPISKVRLTQNAAEVPDYRVFIA